MECPDMTRSDGNSDLSILYSTATASTSPVQGVLSLPFYGSVPQLAVRPREQRWIRRAVDAVLTWQERARERRQLMQLNDHMLRDIGISRAEAFGEAEKFFWRA
jgi:uncharacterized protein YjiS (DUF1127 family)